MSTTLLRLIPSDPELIPEPGAQDAAVELLGAMFPEGEIDEPDVYEATTFIDQGENLESIICPSCHAALKIDYFSETDTVHEWWLAATEPLEENGGIVEGIEVHMPCCSAVVPFRSLHFDWPAGFARFELCVRDPEVHRPLPAEQIAQLEQALGCKVLQIWCHY